MSLLLLCSAYFLNGTAIVNHQIKLKSNQIKFPLQRCPVNVWIVSDLVILSWVEPMETGVSSYQLCIRHPLYSPTEKGNERKQDSIDQFPFITKMNHRPDNCGRQHWSDPPCPSIEQNRNKNKKKGSVFNCLKIVLSIVCKRCSWWRGII